jgi:MoxR-like ATPase
LAGNPPLVINALVQNIDQVIRGKRAEIRFALGCLLTEGHLLLDDIPGTGKTSIAKAIANSIAGGWRRVQFTPDVPPTNVPGVMVFDHCSGQFNFRQGPVFTNAMIGDAINRRQSGGTVDAPRCERRAPGRPRWHDSPNTSTRALSMFRLRTSTTS